MRFPKIETFFQAIGERLSKAVKRNPPVEPNDLGAGQTMFPAPAPPDETDRTGSQPASLKDVIQIVAERIHYADGRRTNFTIGAGVLIAGGVALLTSVYDKPLAAWIRYAVIAGAIAAILAGAAVLLAYALQTNRYPWTQATKTWKWFYRDALPEEKKFNTGWLSLIWFERDKSRVQGEYTNQLPRFKETIKALDSEDVSYDQDVQQLYVLHINDKYKNIHLSQLRTLLGTGIVVVLISALSAGVLGAISDRNSRTLHYTKLDRPGYAVESRWHQERAASGGKQVVISTVLSNTGTTHVLVPVWEARSDVGNPIPGNAHCTRSTKAVAPKSSQVFTCVLQPYSNARVRYIWGHRP